MKKEIGVLLTKKQYLILKNCFFKDGFDETYIDRIYDYKDFFLLGIGIAYFKRYIGERVESCFIGDCKTSERLAEQFARLDKNVDYSLIEIDNINIVGTVTTGRCVLFEDKEITVTLNRNDYYNITDFDVTIYYSKRKEYAAKLLMRSIWGILKGAEHPISNKRKIRYIGIPWRVLSMKKSLTHTDNGSETHIES